MGGGGNASSKRLGPGVFKSRAAEGERPTWRHQSLGPNQPLDRLTGGACSPSQIWRVANRNVNIGKAHFDEGLLVARGLNGLFINTEVNGTVFVCSNTLELITKYSVPLKMGKLTL